MTLIVLSPFSRLRQLTHTYMKNTEANIKATLHPSEKPGAHERHLIRRKDNILFGDHSVEVNRDSLQQSQKTDHSILQRFTLDFREVLSKVLALQSNEDSDVIIAIKDQLDKLYALSASVADDQSKVQASIKKLTDVIMQSLQKGAAQDTQGLEALRQESAAREANYAFLESKLVADILDPESPIESEDLLPTLLSAEKDDLALATQLFDLEQMTFLLDQGKQLLDKLDTEIADITQASQNYVFMEGYLKYINCA